MCNGQEGSDLRFFTNRALYTRKVSEGRVGAYVRMRMRLRTMAGSYRLTSGASFPPRLILWRLEVNWERLAAGRIETAKAQG